ncbi:MAG: membrane protein of unknown function [Promethearchaeota archaeon]|nr:MAG: membrane protein of unknown function [Candidatus Lokiarchaeota archaeon]
MAAYFGINITFGLMHFTLTNGFEDFNPLSILALLVLAIFYLPSYLVTGIIGSGGEVAVILLAIGTIAASVIAAILSGYFGESKGAAFGGWALTIITAYIIVIILGFFAFPVLGSFFDESVGLYNFLFGTFEEEGISLLEIDIITDLIGISTNPYDLSFYKLLIDELGGIQSISELVIVYNSLNGWTPSQALQASVLLKQVMNKSILEQYILFNVSIGWDLEFTLTNIFAFQALYSPPMPSASSLLTYVSITAAVNAVLYGMFALGAKRAEFF